MSVQERRVLVVGWRSGIGAALKKLGVPFAVWTETPLKRDLADSLVRVLPYGQTPERSRELSRSFGPHGPFTHVIAGTENAVVAASYARRELGARRSKHTTAMRCHDKLFMKNELSRHGVPMTSFVDGNEPRSPERIMDELGAPIVVKDRKASGGRGQQVLHTEEEVAQSPKKHRILERFVDAPEISVESFVSGGQVRFENVTEYLEKKHVNGVAAELPPELAAEVSSISRRVIDALRISWGMTHLELYLTSAGPLFGEIAIRPPGGYIMEAMGLAYDFDAWEAFVRIELDLPLELPDRARWAAASMVLHPGAGTITDIRGVESVRSDPNVHKLKIKVAPGDVIDPRTGVGSDVGYILFRAPDRPALLESIARARRDLVFVKA